MRFGRVLATTALAVVLTTSLFSGWLASSAVAKIPVARAQTYSQDDVAKWFNNADFDIGKAAASVTDSSPPTLVMPKAVLVAAGGAPPGDITFTLTGYAGVGAVFAKDQEWLTFQASVNGTVVPNLYLTLSDANDANFVYGTDLRSIQIGFKQAYKEVGRLNGNVEAYIGKIFTYIENVPLDTNGTTVLMKCGGAATVKITGPTDAIPKPDIQHASDAPYNIDPGNAELMNGDCANVGANGWLNKWGVQIVTSTASPGTGCGFSEVVNISGGIGPAIISIFACVIKTIIDGVYAPLSTITQGAGDQIGALECNLAADATKCQVNGNNPNPSFILAWKFSLGLINIVVILALLAIAFANILHLNLNSYAAKKALPGLVIGVAGANASLLLIRFVLDIAKALQIFAFDIARVDTAGAFVQAFMNKIGKAAFSNTLINVTLAATAPVAFIVIVIFAIFFFYLLFVFAWAMIKRLVYIYALTILAPLAFVAYGVPGMQQWFTKWWDMMLRQIFMLPIVFLAAALLIRYVDITIDIAKIGALDVSGLINLAIIFLSALFILKLPGLITKGAVDITNAAKKAFGWAKGTPLAAARGALGTHEFLAGGGKERFSAGALRTLRLRNQAGVLAESARKKRNSYKDNYKKPLSIMKGARGYAKLFDDPNLLWESYQERVKQSQKEDKIAALTRTHRIPGKIRGGAAEALVAKGLALDEMKDARTKAEVQEWRDGLGGGHLGKVYNKDDKSRNLWERMKEIANGDPLKLEELRQKFGAIGNQDDMINFIERDVAKGGLGISNQWDIHDLMKVSGYESVISKLARQARLVGPEGQQTATQTAVAKRPQIDPEGRDFTPPAGGAAPSGVQRVEVVNQVNLSPQGEAAFSRIAEHAQALAAKLTSEQLSAISGQSVADALAGEVGGVLKDQLGSLAGDDAIVRHVISAAASGGDMTAVRQQLQAGEAIEHTDNQLAGQAAAFSDDQLNRLAGIINTNQQAALQEVSGILAPHLQQLSQAVGVIADPNLQAKYAQRIIDGFRQVMTQGPRSVRAYWDQTMGKFATAFAQENNIDHITPESIAKAVAQAQSQPAATPAPPLSQPPAPPQNPVSPPTAPENPASPPPAPPLSQPPPAPPSGEGEGQ